MAEFLVKKCESECTNTNYDHWCNGDLVDIRKDDFIWGCGECPPHFYILKVPFLSVQDLTHYLIPLLSSSGTVIKQSKWKHVEESGIFYSKEDGTIKNVPEEL